MGTRSDVSRWGPLVIGRRQVLQAPRFSESRKMVHSGTAEPGPSASTEEIKMEDIYRKCWSGYMIKAFTDGRGDHRVDRKPLWLIMFLPCNIYELRPMKP